VDRRRNGPAYEYYSWIAVFALVTVLQVGHLGGHTVQVAQLQLPNGTIACPPWGLPLACARPFRGRPATPPAMMLSSGGEITIGKTWFTI